MTPTPEEFSLIDQALEAAKANIQCAQNIVALFKSGKSPAPPPPLTRDRIAAAVEGLFRGNVGDTFVMHHIPWLDRLEAQQAAARAVVAHLCRELGVEG